MRFFILTDLEGPAGVDSFTQTRTTDLEAKGPAMKQLSREVNACIEGIRMAYPDAGIDVLDGHGTGGLFPEDIVGGRYVKLEGDKPYYHLNGYAAMLFVGQHAMAGTVKAPLCHTYSSLHVLYYRLNGVFIGEFGARALVAGHQSVPTIFLSGDDKACAEAKMFIPEIETVVTKRGTGLESAEHLSAVEACDAIRDGALRAVKRMGDIPPFVGLQPPYHFEARHYEPLDVHSLSNMATLIDDRTFEIRTTNLEDLPF